MRRPKALTVTVLTMIYLPFVATATLVGYAFGWRFPIAALVLLVVFLLRGRRRGYGPRSAGRVLTILEAMAFSLLVELVSENTRDLISKRRVCAELFFL